MKSILLAHYYVPPQVQRMATFVGDSLELSLKAKKSNADRIVFAGTRFMAETAKLLNQNAEVILPHSGATCSLVTQVEEDRFDNYTLPRLYLEILDTDRTVITYINSSARLKSISDIIVTSANVEDIVTSEINKGNKVFFTPDRNMGAYLKETHPEWGNDFTYWGYAVCEVHDKFKEAEISKVMNGWIDGKKYLIAHPESPLPVLRNADLVGSTSKMLQWIKDFSANYATIFVATEDGILYNMREARPDLDIRLAPTYSGCQCNSCPYMKLNNEINVLEAMNGKGEVIEIDDYTAKGAVKSINKMLDYE